MMVNSYRSFSSALWDVRRKRCSREPPCALWDEDLLLDEGQRNYGQPRGQHAARPFYDAEAPPPYDDEDADSANSMIAVDNVNWMYDRGEYDHANLYIAP
ncbi:hypothetical protein AcW1_001737 [Taiwanofungus camphoratus]|nr:hypothetical protein AcV7_001590 [Antrodia cinnamomea]KAI0945539.1 hypothetical protein AcW1_001737 [Antrodia cinnamomea]